VLTGAAGFLGSHLATARVGHGVEVVAIDNLIAGNAKNLDHLFGAPRFRFLEYDVTDYLHVPCEKLVGSDSVVEHVGRPIDDPQVRKPDITLAREHLDCEPEVSLEDGLARIIEWFRPQLT
jgi:nucleoside-diphosphate-sugar epimerase